MSVLVKGMEMPKNGDYVFSFASDENGQNTLLRIVEYPSFEIIEHGGVVELPPHGRLIDASTKVTAKYYVDADGKETEQRTTTLDEMLTGICELPPTIIEAEEGEG